MKLGLWGARADQRGLAYQTQSFYKHLRPVRTLAVDMTSDGLSPYVCDWRPFNLNDTHIVRNSQINEGLAREWLRGLDVVIGAETFYRDEFPLWAKAEGVKTVLQINPEFVGWWHKGRNDPKPDVIINPSTWRMDKLPGAIHLPFPVDREMFPFRHRKSANHFVHVAGHPAAADRAGTRSVVGSIMRVRNVTISIRSQAPLPWDIPTGHRKVNLQTTATTVPSELYADADVVLAPRRYGGQSLVANEALSSGCPLIVLDRHPDNTWAGVVKLPARTRGHLRTKAGLIAIYDPSPATMAVAINKLHEDPLMVETLSAEANMHANSISWQTLLPVYQDFLRSVCEGQPSLIR